MLPTPTKFTLVSGTAEGHTRLNAFDHALLDAGVGNCNLLKVSSILPPGASYLPEVQIPPGALVPIAYGAICLDQPGELISAAVAVGVSDEKTYGVIMEYSGRTSREEAEKIIRGMVEEAFEKRGLPLNLYMVRSVEHRVVEAGCAFAGVVLWY
ncbi:MAG: arginine decarboxylase, pyruvoyl-dependent [Peptococcaceae bacterium]|nr:arginine decarboxylase, pyruvoyl-dependent [Peptococcaceae bacterium]